jgi:regulator of cell morphogenesis and NO signaling
MTLDPQASVASLVLDHPGAADLLERLDVDFCCHGNRSLAEACAERDLDVETIVRVLEARAGVAGAETSHAYDARAASTAELCEHIVAAHHEPLRAALHVCEQVAGETVELLFPACVTVAAGGEPADERVLLAELEDEHADVGEALRALRELTDGFGAENARCGTHRALLDGLAVLERDLHLHIHEENNVLFPRIRSRLAA